MPIWQNLYTFSNIYEQTAAAAQHSQLDQEERKEDGRFALGHVGFGQIWPQRRGNSFLKPHNSSLGFHIILSKILQFQYLEKLINSMKVMNESS